MAVMPKPSPARRSARRWPALPTGLTTDRWVKAVEIREVLFDEDGLELGPASEAAGGKSDAARADLNLFVVHHAVIMAAVNTGGQDRHPNRQPDPDAGVGTPDGLFGIIHELRAEPFDLGLQVLVRIAVPDLHAKVMPQFRNLYKSQF